MKPTPRLVKDRDTGKLCMQLVLGQHSATYPLPEAMAGWSQPEIQEHMNSVVEEMMTTLVAMHQEDKRKFRRKAKQCVSGITKSELDSPEETVPPLLKT